VALSSVVARCESPPREVAVVASGAGEEGDEGEHLGGDEEGSVDGDSRRVNSLRVAAGSGAGTGKAVQVDPIKATLKALRTKRLKLKCYVLLLNVAFNPTCAATDRADFPGARERAADREPRRRRRRRGADRAHASIRIASPRGRDGPRHRRC
jgi:hypothetical protein